MQAFCIYRLVLEKHDEWKFYSVADEAARVRRSAAGSAQRALFRKKVHAALSLQQHASHRIALSNGFTATNVDSTATKRNAVFLSCDVHHPHPQMGHALFEYLRLTLADWLIHTEACAEHWRTSVPRSCITQCCLLIW